VTIIERELAELEGNLGSVKNLQLVVGFLRVVQAALGEAGNGVSRAALIRLKARLERLAMVVYKIQGLVEQRIQTILAELQNGG
jgi:hypothetical protein